VVEHRRTLEQGLRKQQRSTRISWQQYPLRERGGGVKVDWFSHTRARTLGDPHITTLRRHETPTGRARMTVFRSPQEFREVMDRTFGLMSEDPEMGPRLREADTPQRFEFTDLGMVVNIRAGEGDEPNLAWEWSDQVSWEPRVRMTMSSETANRYFQGKENVAIAIARRRIKAGGDVKAALAIIPITKPLFARYREMIAADYPHLEV
jgi:hypothetical protein